MCFNLSVYHAAGTNMRIKVSILSLLLFCFLSVTPSFAQSVGFSVKQLSNRVTDTNNANLINYSLEKSSFELRASKKIKTSGVNEIMVYPEGYDGYDGPEEDSPANLLPRLTLAKDLRFNPQNVYRSEDSSLIVLQVLKGKDVQWIFIEADNVRELARLPFSEVSVINSRLQFGKAPPDKLKKAVASIVPQPEWKKHIWDQDYDKINAANEMASDWSDLRIPKGSDISAAKLLRELMTVKKLPVDPKLLLGDWRVRSLQGNSNGLYLYSFSKATIRTESSGLIFEKTSGSQHRMGRLYKDTATNRLIFLGGIYVNGDKPQAYSAGWGKVDAFSPNKTDTAGVLFKLNDKRMLMILDADDYDSTFEVYELVR
jgi:hypothetical protein